MNPDDYRKYNIHDLIDEWFVGLDIRETLHFRIENFIKNHLDDFEESLDWFIKHYMEDLPDGSDFLSTRFIELKSSLLGGKIRDG